MRTIAIINQKGGSGKTTTTVNLGAFLSAMGQKVLIVDLDPQANASTHLGIRSPEKSICNFLADSNMNGIISNYEMKELGQGILDIIPSQIGLASMESQLMDEMGREGILKRKLNKVSARYNFILIDCPPSLGIFTINALTASTETIVPVQAEFFALDGVANLLQTLSAVRERINPHLVVTGAVLTMFDVRNNICREVVEKVKEIFGSQVFSTVIRQNIKLAEAPSRGIPIMKYDPDCNGSQDYRKLAEELIGVNGGQR